MSEIVPTNSAGDFQQFIHNSFSNVFVPVAGCKVCASQNRIEAENRYEKSGNYKAAYRFLAEEMGEDISYSSVKNHMGHHYNKVDDSNNLTEFSSKLKTWSKLNKDDLVFFQRYIDFFDMEAMELASKSALLPLPERRKNDEMIIKIGQLLSTYKEQVHQLNTEMRPVEVVIKSLNRIIQVKLEGSPSPEVKRVLTDIIDQLLSEIGDVSLDGDKSE